MSATTRNLQPVIVTPEDATTIAAFGGVITTLRAEQTGGRYSVVDFTLTVTIEGEQRQAPAGSTIFIPRGVVHTFSNQGDTPAHFLFLMSPGGFERCFDELAAATVKDGEVTPTAFAEITSRYDVRIVV